MESEKVDESNAGLRTHSATSISEGDQDVPGKVSRSSSSLSRSSSSDRLQLTKSNSNHTDDDIPVSSMPRSDHNHDHSHSQSHSSVTSSNDGSTTKFPPPQVMERPADSKFSSSYRIPSSVFARTKSKAPVEWSVASNESLFSIQMGNMSFIRDHDSWFANGEYTYDSTLSGPLIDMSSDQPPSTQQSVAKSSEIAKSAAYDNERFHVTKPKVNDRNSGHLERNSKENFSNKGAVDTDSIGRHSDASITSVKSFAFPILTNDKSVSAHNKHPRPQAQSPKAAELEHSPPVTPKQDITPNATPTTGQGKWLSCFPCGRFCS